MKVLHIIHNADIGGAQVLLRDILQNWRRTDIELVLLTHIEGYYLSDYEGIGIQIYKIDFEQPLLKRLLVIRRILQKVKPDIVHNHLWMASLLGSITSAFYNNKVFNQIHNVLLVTDRPRWKLMIYKQLLYIFRFTRCHFVAVSNYELNALKQLGFREDRLHLVYNGIKLRNFFLAQLPHNINEPIKLLFIGRLSTEKGVKYLIDAIDQLDSDNIQLSIVGDGSLREELKSQADKANLYNVQFLGFHKDVRPLIATHHVLVLPSLWEVFGIVIAEAMAMGKPIIATNVGGIPELVIHEKGGYLCPAADPVALAKAILKLHNCPEKIAAFGEFNRLRVVEHFSLERTIENLEQLYLSDV